MASQSFTAGPLSKNEVALRNFGRRIRTLIPEACGEHPPAPGYAFRRSV
jgi:hypothetical protein